MVASSGIYYFQPSVYFKINIVISSKTQNL
jgi:hypothetical protein